jgi:cytochrome P450
VATAPTVSDVYYDPYDVEINADPYPVYARLRDEAPIYYNEPYDFWMLTRQADIEEALKNWRVFSSTRSDILDVIRSGFDLPGGVIMFEDPPTHTMHRGLLSRVFTPRRMAELEGRVRQYCIDCLDPLVGSSGFDIIQELGTMLPMKVIGMLLGIPEQDQVVVRNKTDDNLRTKPGQPMECGRTRSLAAPCSRSTSIGGSSTRPTTQRSGTASTSAWAPAWPDSRVGWRWTRC